MDMIVAKPKNAEEAEAVLRTLTQMNTVVEIHRERTDGCQLLNEL